MIKMADYKRIHEIFFQNIGEAEKDTSLKCFIRDGFRHFIGTCRQESDNLRQIVYPGSDICFLALNFTAPAREEARLTGMELRGRTCDFEGLIGLLHGTLAAEYDDLNLRSFSENTQEYISRQRKKRHSLIGVLGMYFSKDPENPDNIRKIELQRKKGIMHRRVPITLEQAAIGDSEKRLLAMANQVVVRNSFYVDYDESRELIQESCKITRHEEEKYIWNYRINSTNHESLPAHIFANLEKLFETIRSYFDLRTYKKLEMKPIG